VEEPIRIISDIHLGHTASLAREITQLEPLFDGVKTVIFNGDTVEMRSERDRDRAEHIMRDLREFCDAQDATTHFINGNHDPIISTTNHLELGGGDLLVTHGDVLFHEIAPWGAEAEQSKGLHDRFLSELDASELNDLEKILSTNKRVSQNIEFDDFNIPDGAWGQLTTFMRQTWPPKRLVRMVASWGQTPRHAINLVKLYRPTAKCVIVGHTHFPGVWHRHGYSVINTGSFLPMLGRLAVDYENGQINVRKVVFRNRKFQLGRQVARFAVNGALTPLPFS
jgi:predicted phosphodiesterase